MLCHGVHTQSLSHVGLFTTRQAPRSMGFSRQEYCSGLTFSPSGDLLEPGIEPMSPASLVSASRFFPTSYGSSLLNFLRKCRYFTSLVQCNFNYFILFDVIINSIVSLISSFGGLLVLYRNAIDLSHIMTLYPAVY